MFEANDGPIFVKYVLNAFAILCSTVLLLCRRDRIHRQQRPQRASKAFFEENRVSISFCWPDEEDLAWHARSDIIRPLPKPTRGGETGRKAEKRVFNCNLNTYSRRSNVGSEFPVKML